MNVKEMIEQLEKIENKERIVVIQIDPEGNGFRRAHGVDDNARFKDGACKLQHLTDEDKRNGFTELDVMDDGEPALVVWP